MTVLKFQLAKGIAHFFCFFFELARDLNWFRVVICYLQDLHLNYYSGMLLRFMHCRWYTLGQQSQHNTYPFEPQTSHCSFHACFHYFTACVTFHTDFNFTSSYYFLNFLCLLVYFLIKLYSTLTAKNNSVKLEQLLTKSYQLCLYFQLIPQILA